MKLNTRRAMCALAVAALLAGDTCLTWRIASRRAANRAAGAPAYSAAPDDPLGRFRLEREQLRARQEAQLNDIIHSDASDGETAAQARAQLLDLLAGARAELAIEGVLQGRGFEDATASVSAQSANVLVRREALTQRESAVILDLVMRETGLTAGNVKIIPVK